jgi:hypothetical protein
MLVEEDQEDEYPVPEGVWEEDVTLKVPVEDECPVPVGAAETVAVVKDQVNE